MNHFAKTDVGGGVLIKSVDGPAVPRQGSKFGIYQMTGDKAEDHPVYKHKCLDVYLFVGPDGSWRIGPDFTTYKKTSFKNPEQPATGNPPRTGWQYWDGKWMDDDDTIEVVDAGANISNRWDCARSD